MLSLIQIKIILALCYAAVHVLAGTVEVVCSRNLGSGDLDQVPTNGTHPCTRIDGYVTIQDSEATNFEILAAVTSVKGLYLEGIPNLTSLQGLRNLRSIERSLHLEYCISLENVNGLSSLTSIGSGLQSDSLVIMSMPALVDLSGFSSLTKIDGSLRIGNQNTGNNYLTPAAFPVLQTITMAIRFFNVDWSLINSFPALDTVDTRDIEDVVGSEKGIMIDGNAQLETISFASLTSLGHQLLVKDNAKLTSLDFIALKAVDSFTVTNNALTALDGFAALQTVKGSLSVSAESSLTSIHGFSSLESVGALSFNANPSLVSVYLAALTSATSVTVTNNALTTLDVGALSINANPSLVSVYLAALTSATSITVTNNDRLESITVPLLEEITTGGLHFEMNYKLRTLAGFDSLAHINSELIVRENAALSEMAQCLPSLRTVGQEIRFENNDNVTAINCFQALETVRSLYIGRNQLLVSVGRFDTLHSVERDVVVEDNSKLFSFSFPVLSSVGTNVDCSSNTALRNVDGFNALQTVGQGIFLHRNVSSVGILVEIFNSPDLTVYCDFFKLESVRDGLSINGNVFTLVAYHDTCSAYIRAISDSKVEELTQQVDQMRAQHAADVSAIRADLASELSALTTQVEQLSTQHELDLAAMQGKFEELQTSCLDESSGRLLPACGGGDGADSTNEGVGLTRSGAIWVSLGLAVILVCIG